MTVFDPKECTIKPRADMFLPNWLNGMGILSDGIAVAALVSALVTKQWWLFILFLLFGVIGIAAYLCWKNQTIRILDNDTFEYTTFLGKTFRYRFSEIRNLRVNTDSLTLFVADGKVHIESIVVISKELMDKIDAALGVQQQNGPTVDA